jgi:MoxR-like ATPase
VATQVTPAADSRLINDVTRQVARRVVGQEYMIDRLIISLLTCGHVLLEGVPGLAKTLTVRTLAETIDTTFSRIQFTPDLLPTDVTGVNVFNQRTNEFEFRPGPVFANILLVDEINRASPKTQAALLECMQEQQVTVDGTSYELARPFMVMATQNPIEYEGTYPLPEAQLDRFTMRLSLGYPPLAEEARMLDEQTSWGSAGSAPGKAGGAQRVDPGAAGAGGPPLDSLPAVADAADVLRLVEAARGVYVEESLGRYVVALLRQTRGDQRLYLGASPRAGIALLRVAKARALSEGREYVTPDDVKAVAAPVLAHRLILAPEARSAGLGAAELVEDALAHTPVPV